MVIHCRFKAKIGAIFRLAGSDPFFPRIGIRATLFEPQGTFVATDSRTAESPIFLPKILLDFYRREKVVGSR